MDKIFILLDVIFMAHVFSGEPQLHSQTIPLVIVCKREKTKGGGSYGPVIRNVFIVECNLSGYGSVEINGKEYSFGPRQCYVLFPGDTVVHHSDAADPREGIYCALDGLNLEQHFKEAGVSTESPMLPNTLFDEVYHWLEQMLPDVGQLDAGAQMRQASRIYGLLGTLMRESTKTKLDNWVSTAIGLMETNYHKPITVSELAEAVGLERTYFSSLFKEKTRFSPYRYLIYVRIQKACILLTETNHSIAQIAELVGLDYRNFARFFQREMKVTPLEFRKNSKNDTSP